MAVSEQERGTRQREMKIKQWDDVSGPILKCYLKLVGDVSEGAVLG